MVFYKTASEVHKSTYYFAHQLLPHTYPLASGLPLPKPIKRNYCASVEQMGGIILSQWTETNFEIPTFLS